MEIIDDAAVAAALALLPGWSGDTGRIMRTVHAASDLAETLRVEVMGIADDVDHHPVVEQHGEALTFILWTHSAGGVTRKDIELAARIDGVLDGDRDTGADTNRPAI